MLLEDRLRAWGAWSRRRGNIYGQADSFEGQFRSPQQWDAPPIPPESVDAADCKAIELAWSTLEGQDKIILRSHYCGRCSIGYTLAKASLGGKKLLQCDWHELLAHAHESILKALERGQRNVGLRRAYG